jgi:hypothetical protein
MPTATDLVTDLPADFEVFGQAVATSMADLLGGTSGQILAKNSNTDMDFVWIANDQGDITGITASSPLTGGGTSGAVTVGIQDALTTQKGAVQLSDSTSTTSSILAATPTAVKAAYDLADGAIAKSTVTTAGDIIYRNATVPVRLGIGTANQVLRVNSGGTAPEWATPASGGGMTLLSTTTLTGAATITISSISQSYTNLYILITGLNVTTGTYTLKLRPDSSDANNYSNLRGGTVATSGPDYISPGNAGHSASSAVNDYALTIYNYTDTTNTKPFFMVGIAKMASQVEPFGVSALGATNVASAIDSFQLSNDSGGNFTAGTVKIYGVN